VNEDTRRDGESAAFYVPGGTLRLEAPSYAVRAADRELHAALTEGEFCYVLTSRQMGKSSLMVRAAARLRDEGAMVAVIDLTAVGLNLTPEQWYAGLLSHVGEQLGLEDELDDFWIEQDVLGPVQRWVAAIEKVILPRADGQVVFFVDEIDAVMSLSFSPDEFFAAIRACYNRRVESPELQQLTFCLIGVASPTDLNEDPRTTPFNIGHRIELADLTEDDGGVLADGLHGDPVTARGLLRRVLYWTNGHPYLTQRLCHAIATDGSAAADADIDRVCGDLFLSEEGRGQDTNLTFARDRVLRSPEYDGADLAGLLTLYDDILRGRRVPVDDANPLVSILKLAGTVRVDGARLRVRNRIYERVFDRAWVRDSMPDAELRRQKQAFWRGARRVSAAVVVFAAIAIYAGVQSVRLSDALATSRADREALAATVADLRIANNVRLLENGDASGLVGLAKTARSLPPGPELRLLGATWASWERRYAGRLRAIVGPEEGVSSFAMSPSATWFATADARGLAQLWRTADRTPHGAALEHGSPISGLSFDPGGRTLETRSDDGVVKLWDVATTSLRATLRHPEAVQFSRFTFDAEHLATLTYTDSGATVVRRWDTDTGDLAAEPSSLDGVVSLGPDAYLLVFDGSIRRAAIVDTATMERLSYVSLPSTISSEAAEDATGAWVVIGFADGSIVYGSLSPASVPSDWPSDGDIQFGSRESDATHHLFDAPVTVVSISGDGRVVAAMTGDPTGQILVLHAETGEPVGRPIFHQSPIVGLRLSYDGSLLAGGAGDTARVWSTESGEDLAGALTFPAASPAPAVGEGVPRAEPSEIKSLAFSGGESPELFVEMANAAPVYVYRVRTAGQVEEVVSYAGGWAAKLGLSEDGSTLVTCSTAGPSAHVWDAAAGSAESEVLGLPHGGVNRRDRAVAVSPDGSAFAIRTLTNIQQYDTASSEPVGPPVSCGPEAAALAYTPDGALLALADGSQIRFLRRADSAQTATVDIGARIVDLAFDRSGTFLAVAVGAEVRFFSYPAGDQVFEAIDHPQAVTHLALGDGGILLATVTSDNAARVWDITTGSRLGRAMRHAARVDDIAFAPRGRFVATAATDSRVRFWDTETGRPHGLPISVPGVAQAIAFTSDGSTMFTGGFSGRVLRWRLPSLPATVEEMVRRTRATTGLRAGPGRSIRRISPAEWHALQAGMRPAPAER